MDLSSVQERIMFASLVNSTYSKLHMHINFQIVPYYFHDLHISFKWLICFVSKNRYMKN